MTEALRLPAPRRFPWAALGVVCAALASVGLGTVIAYPSPIGDAIVLVVGSIAVTSWIFHRPYHGFLINSGTVFFLVVYAVTLHNYLNAGDIVMPALGLASYFGVARRQANAEDALLRGPAHEKLARLIHEFRKAGILFGVLVFVSIGWLAINVGAREAFQNVVFSVRTIEGALCFPLAMWWLRTEKRIHQTIGAILVTGALMAAVNIYQVLGMGTFRAGMTWVVNHLDWPMESANEAGFTTVLIWVLILARHQVKPTLWTYPALAVDLLILLLTQSRSSLIGLLIFTVLSVRRIRWQYVAAALILVPLALRFVPEDFFHRMARSLTWEKGTFEVYSMVVRLYGYQSSLMAFLDNWLFGVGYFGLIYVSQNYNDMRITDLGAENIYLEIAAGMGVIGLAAAGWWFWKLLKVGPLVRKLSPPGTLGHVLGGFHIPYVAAIAFTSLTNVSVIGQAGLGQLLLWTAMVMRAGHLAIESRTPSPPEKT
jgi:hypothetical protein